MIYPVNSATSVNPIQTADISLPDIQAEPEATATQKKRRGRPPKPVSAAKLEANRRNWKQSTGPKTERGKRHSRRNALKHGLRAETTILEGEELARFEELRRELSHDREPVGAAEEFLVHDIASCLWRLERALRCEQGTAVTELATRVSAPELPEQQLEALKAQFRIPFGDSLDRILRYETTFHRRVLSNLATLERLQATRKDKDDNGAEQLSRLKHK
jgi:hypothetical protein